MDRMDGKTGDEALDLNAPCWCNIAIRDIGLPCVFFLDCRYIHRGLVSHRWPTASLALPSHLPKKSDDPMATTSPPEEDNMVHMYCGLSPPTSSGTHLILQLVDPTIPEWAHPAKVKVADFKGSGRSAEKLSERLVGKANYKTLVGLKWEADAFYEELPPLVRMLQARIVDHFAVGNAITSHVKIRIVPHFRNPSLCHSCI